MSFVVKKNLSLAWVGDDWAEAYVILSPMTYAENRSLLDLKDIAQNPEKASIEQVKRESDKMFKQLQDHFIEGKGYDGEKLVDITPENLETLPQYILEYLLSEMQGQGLKKN